MKSQKKIYRRARVCSQELQDNITIEEIQLRLMSRTWFVCCSFFQFFFRSSFPSLMFQFRFQRWHWIHAPLHFLIQLNFSNYENENRKLFFNNFFFPDQNNLSKMASNLNNNVIRKRNVTNANQSMAWRTCKWFARSKLIRFVWIWLRIQLISFVSSINSSGRPQNIVHLVNKLQFTPFCRSLKWLHHGFEAHLNHLSRS